MYLFEKNRIHIYIEIHKYHDNYVKFKLYCTKKKKKIKNTFAIFVIVYLDILSMIVFFSDNKNNILFYHTFDSLVVVLNNF